MENISDEELINAVRGKIEEKDKALFDLKMLNQKLEDTNQRLLESERLKSAFLSNLKNELNNPMASILGLCDEIRRIDLKDAGKFRQIADSLFCEAISLDFQLNNILTAAEFESGEFLIDMVKTDVNSIIDSAINILSPMIEGRNITIRKNIHEPLWINSDPEKLRTIIDNLINNAVVFNKDGGEINIEAELLEGIFFLSVKDTGIGIPHDKLKLIFDRFFQLEKGSTKRYHGHGLGLSVAKAAANFLNGDISVTSSMAAGSRFTLMVPANKDFETSNIYVDGVEFFEEVGEMKEF